MRQLTIPYDATNYSILLTRLRARVAFKKSDQLVQNHRLCVDVLPGFNMLSQQQQNHTILNAFADMAVIIEHNKQQYSGAASTALICVSYIEKFNIKTIVHLTIANIAGCCIYIVIKNKMDQIKRYQRLNNDVSTVYDPSLQQPSTSNKRNFINGDNLTNSFWSVQIAHHAIPLADDEELFLIAAEGIKSISFAKSGDTTGVDAKNISIVCRHRRWCDAATHLIDCQSTYDNAIAINKVIDSSQRNDTPSLIGVFSAYKNPQVAELLVQQLPDQIFSKLLNHFDSAQGQQLRANRSEIQTNIANEFSEGGSPVDNARNLSDIYAEINSHETKIKGLQEVFGHLKSKYQFDNAGDFGYLHNNFDSLIGNINVVITLHKDDLDIHRHNILHKYVFFIDKSDSWQQLLKDLRELAFDWLKRLATKCETSEQSINLLSEYRNLAVFTTHRANHWFQKIGRTQTVIEIDKLIESYKTKPRIAPI